MFEEIQQAAQRIAGYAVRTPALTLPALNERLGAEVYLKCENLQRIGAFKFRGAFNAISQLSQEEKGRGVITYSSGNHAQAVALVGRLLGVKATIVMPHNAPVIKRRATESYGATVIDYNPSEQDREALALELAAQHGYVVIPPYDYYPTILGQGTAALELYQDHPDLSQLLACVGGGGLLSGCAIAAKGMNPQTQVIGIEPEVANDATLSFRTGVLHTIHNPPTIADGTRTPSLGKLTFPLVQQYVDDMQTVTEEAIKAAVAYAFYTLKLVIEPSGALGLAALLSGAVKPQGKTGVIISGGNIDASTLHSILSEPANDPF
jgi:threonine dehydratase